MPIPSPHPFLIHSSHRVETLAERLADEMRRRPGDPLLAERIVVPHPIMGRWLRLQLATELGVAAHLRIELPAAFAWAAMREAMPALPTVPVYEPAYLRWRIFERLDRWDGDDEIARYLADGDARKRFELADRLAIAYDRCLVYRPDSIRAWQTGESSHWHGRLWAELAADHVSEHQPKSRRWIDVLDDYHSALVGQAARPRVSFFAVATLSPSYLEMLHLATAAMEIHLFLLSPRRDFWATRPSRKAGGYYAEENELLEAWGRPARDLQAMLYRRQAVEVVDQLAARDQPSGDTCLGTVQADIVGAAAPSVARNPGRLHSDPHLPLTGSRSRSAPRPAARRVRPMSRHPARGRAGADARTSRSTRRSLRRCSAQPAGSASRSAAGGSTRAPR